MEKTVTAESQKELVNRDANGNSSSRNNRTETETQLRSDASYSKFSAADQNEYSHTIKTQLSSARSSFLKRKP